MTEEMLDICHRELPSGALTSQGALVLSFHAFVVRMGRYRVLVDSCCGDDKERPGWPQFDRQRTGFLSALAAAGVKAHEIDFVMCSHLHFDHVGWNTCKIDGQWQPTFPNAKYVVARREYEHWSRLHAQGLDNIHTRAFADSVQPVVRAGQALQVDDGFELGRGLRIETCPGHTPGNYVVHLESNGAHGVISGDVVHHPVQLRFPELGSRADDHPHQAQASRLALLQRHADTGHWLLPAHFPPPTVGRLVSMAHGGFGYNPA